jgi:pyruvate dehydrogenase E2 component (dihydrolipoamide acetyltransferase)
MPSLGADMEAGTLVQWLKHQGDPVKRGDIIAVVDTQKGAIEIEVFEDGTLEHIVVTPGEKVPVGTVLAVIRGAGQEAAATARPVASAAPATTTPPALPHAGVAGIDEATRRRVSPLARKIAADLGVDLDAVEGTGPNGAVTRADVERAAARKAPTAAAPAAAPPRADMRAAIAAAMARSKREIPHYYLSTTVDAGAAIAWLGKENEKRPIAERLLIIALFVKAVALALRDVPELNGHWSDGAFRQGSGIHVGCAIALRGGGLVAPAVHDADHQNLEALMRHISDLVTRARAGSLRSSELADPTITLTNLGEQGVDAAFGIIYPPQVALVGFGRISDRPWVVSDQVRIRPVVTATLAGDHRASDGHRGGLLLAAIDRLLQTPEKL